MLYRAFVVMIIAFWGAMTALLVRSELYPDGSQIRAVPLHHVLKLFFQNEQPSDLAITASGVRVGHLRLQPKVNAETKTRTIEVIGNVLVRLQDAQKQRFSWDGSVELDRAMNLQRLDIALIMHERQNSRAELVVEPLKNLATLTYKAGDRVVDVQTFTLDEAGAKTALDRAGIDPALIPVSTRAAAGPELSARQSSLKIRHETVETYLVTLQQNGQTLLEIHVSQIGQILSAKTFLDVTFAPPDLLP